MCSKVVNYHQQSPEPSVNKPHCCNILVRSLGHDVNQTWCCGLLAVSLGQELRKSKSQISYL